MKKCEWKEELVEGSPVKFVKTGLIFHPCERMRFRFTAIRMFPGLCEKVISHGEEVFDYCPYCGADIRKPEPEKNYTMDNVRDNLEDFFSGKYDGMTIKEFRERKPESVEPLIVKSGETFVKYENGVNYLCLNPRGIKSYWVWKPFSEITLDDEIAKLRPMCRFISSDPHNPGQLTWKNILVYVDENDYMTGNGTSHSECKLLTAKELQEAE